VNSDARETHVDTMLPNIIAPLIGIREDGPMGVYVTKKDGKDDCNFGSRNTMAPATMAKATKNILVRKTLLKNGCLGASFANNGWSSYGSCCGDWGGA
jgi:hypothetical protein